MLTCGQAVRMMVMISASHVAWTAPPAAAEPQREAQISGGGPESARARRRSPAPAGRY
jgi:hypothetical protein